MASKLSDQELTAALDAIKRAQKVRALHRKRTDRGSATRETDIKLALDGLKQAMRPIRRWLSSYHYGPQSVTLSAKQEKVQQVSKALQAERRKLWKMRRK